jgi:hypothetical protein
MEMSSIYVLSKRRTEMRSALVPFGLMIMLAGNAAAQNAPNPETQAPFYIWTGHPSGGPERSEESRADGSLPIDNAGAHFHFFALRFKQATGKTAPKKLRFVYDCYYNPQNSGEGKEQKGVESGQPCPSGKTPASAFIIAFRITLAGDDARKYELSYSCRLDGGAVQRKAGEYCGEPRFQGTAGVHAMTIQLKKIR